MCLSLPAPGPLRAFLLVLLTADSVRAGPLVSQETHASAVSLAITPVTVIDVREGVARPDRTVVVEGDRITAVGPAESVEIPCDARVVDGTGKFLIPGLWDMHVHLFNQISGRQLLVWIS